jgi:hypothetical protein
MNWMYPSMLWFLLALAIPIIIHLFQFRRVQKLIFPNIRFLKELIEERASSNKIKHWWVLIARFMMFALIIMAFAQPYLGAESETISEDKTLIIIDNSLSMQCTKGGKSLLSIAKEQATNLVNAYPTSQTFSILSNQALSADQKNVTVQEAGSIIKALNYTKASNAYESWLMNMSKGYQQVHIFSDFQNKTIQDLRFEDAETQVFVHAIQPDVVQNVSIDTFYCLNRLIAPERSLNWVFRLRNDGKEDRTSNIRFELNGQVKYVINALIPAQSTFQDTIELVQTNQALNTSALYISDELNLNDDVYYQSWELQEKVNVVEIAERQDFAIKTAFELDPIFNYAFVPSNANSLPKNIKFIILNSVSALSSGLSTQIQEAQQQGCNILFIPSQDISQNNKVLNALSFSGFSGFEQQEGRFEVFNTNESLLSEVFVGKHIKAFDVNYKGLFTMPSMSNWLVKNGFEQTLVAYEHQLNSNIFVLCFAPEASNFAQSALYLPFLYEMALSSESKNIHTTSINASFLSLDKEEVSETDKIEIKHGDEVWTTGLVFQQSQQGINISDISWKTGFAQVWLNGKELTRIGVNGDPQEAKLNYFNSNEITQVFKSAGFSNIEEIASDISDAQLKLSVQEKQPLWQYCILLAAVFMLIEMLLLRKI